MLDWLLNRWVDWLFGPPAPRLEGAVAVEWERGEFTKDRTDLPPSPTRLEAHEAAWLRFLQSQEMSGFRRR